MYTQPIHFERALKDHAAKVVEQDGGTIQAVMRGFFFQRLTARLFTAEPEGWLLKGGQALLARYPSGARLSTDIDLQGLHGTIEEAYAALLAGAAVDLRDHLRFVPKRMKRQGKDGDGIMQAFEVNIGSRPVLSLHVDLVTGKNVTADPATFQLMPRPDLPWPTEWPPILLYPVVDHLADKICAMYEWHRNAPSSRHRDLADILLISQNETIDAAAAHHALHAEVAFRLRAGTDLRMPAKFEMPARGWRDGYAEAAKDVAGLNGCATWTSAEFSAAAFITPLLGEAFRGTWHPDKSDWAREERQVPRVEQ
ncbi:nucleotidyl transferase AbiEii/AbiGii toxin family protein [Streptomyces goshikiensis]|uniref:nucleotidyl transferase AbiEii/AbiGii toxin family protein n=1 Tax=Streptomyces goshikiensis TaxID=1942 RepID=UPI0036F79D5F